MTLAEQITHNMRAAMKAKDSATLSTLRLLVSAMKNRQIELRHELTDTQVQDVVKSQVKQLKDSIVSFEAGGRADMATSAHKEIVVLEQYLPAQLADEELDALVKRAVEESGASTKVDMGSAMGAAMKAVAGRADGTRVKEIVGTLLGTFVLVAVGVGAFALDAQAAVSLTDTFGTGTSTFAFLLRVARVLMLWLGIIGITMILNGGFEYMTASMRDDLHTSALTKMTHGIFASILVAVLFAFCTIVLQQIG